MTTIDATQFEEICEGVWTDRADILSRSGELTGEATLVRAVFWRLCKAGIKTKGCSYIDGPTPALLAYELVIVRMLNRSAQPDFDGALILKGLVERYQTEVAAE